MLSGRRVGTLTAGITLVVFGLLFIGRTILPSLDYSFIMSLWPLVLIFVGIEIIVSYIVNKKEKICYDTGAIVLVLFLVIFAVFMGCVEFAMEHIEEFRI